ncbi:MAG TPA: SWIB/MDM2 domain-containing protein [Candidatus Acidoferrum sp.]|jgi:upstream activation factor subunit UAF30|nr:SWIB/MDM2 domain-containing protein [Candidatus Acidoferrum sp.]
MDESTSQPKAKRQANAAFMKPVQPDEKLAAIIGHEAVPRTEVTRKLWEYIRNHNLQDPENRTFIKADENLKQVFDGKDRVSMFEMTKLVSNHVK